jgi:hypothetical protein
VAREAALYDVESSPLGAIACASSSIWRVATVSSLTLSIVEWIEPEQNEVVRSVGRPEKEGKCKLSSGMLVASF